MRVHLCAVGRIRSGPERALVDDYLKRFDRSGRALGLGPAAEHEVEDKRGGGREAEAELLARAVPTGALLVVLDERGRVMTSPDFAAVLGGWRDAGRSDVAFVIGGADGIAPALRARADFALSFGQMVWPHMLVRVMLAEQLYRAASILAGAPYHRE
ncbi:23S rRNA (pseudouridine(1915)-N(3))-methyltransferase RlmH [Frigidibacter albus]|uniref:Ribosomal RNA large subunit methyltransferase H n=1 Tax=Frigidibacter albus TaxID=1465486 RepID=A0A6L8VC00_9RHOB|nr:23S rRNA (pseudouridine(1915)-N(3))-methyltransferase RlmH [Frigidibacter albus]MZQ87825.1 23S rRNA (pseudouridine(1915)-N(3))-methyltransferase RlmH [Frigidibacter albus]NBE29731.1 23S rRNA (pseudouridine(1915)-N(3))-methyltransferase RlmH [Frigidibacter albus]GGH43081.1 ribosomal RNA large subunit methyltransferase H [Frigidibacter albus]